MGMDYEEAMDHMKDAADADAQDHAAREEYEDECRQKSIRIAELTSANADLRESLAASEATVARLVGERDKLKNRSEVWEYATLQKDKQLSQYIEFVERIGDDMATAKEQLLAAEALSESRRLALEGLLAICRKFHEYLTDSVNRGDSNFTPPSARNFDNFKAVANAKAAIAATGSTSLAELKRDVRAEALREWANGMECHNSPSSEWIKRKMLEYADAIAAGTEDTNAAQ